MSYLLALLLAIATLSQGLGTLSPSKPTPSGAVVDNNLLCNGAQWQSFDLFVSASGCQPIFGVSYIQDENPSGVSSSNQYNFSFSIPWIVELSPGGELVRIASLDDADAGLATVVNGPGEVNLSSTFAANVTNVTGGWVPNDSWAGDGPQWNISNASLGATTVNIVFHLTNLSSNASQETRSNTSFGVEFDVDVSGWPWASTTDTLGLGFDCLGSIGSHFAFNQSSRTLAESWNSTGRTFASLVFGRSANVSYPPSLVQAANVTEQAGLFHAYSNDRRSVVLLNFSGVPGNYSSMEYDPWVVFTPGLLIPSQSSSTPDVPLVSVLVALVLVASVGVASTIWLNGRRLRREGRELVEGIEKAISNKSDPPNRRP
ncbi:MAG: hypothetical protein L3K03_00010 [Thermoplasmata archaeon]|nr:hypothetical protein [Thermoplasmata archaeon]